MPTDNTYWQVQSASYAPYLGLLLVSLCTLLQVVKIVDLVVGLQQSLLAGCIPDRYWHLEFYLNKRIQLQMIMLCLEMLWLVTSSVHFYANVHFACTTLYQRIEYSCEHGMQNNSISWLAKIFWEESAHVFKCLPYGIYLLQTPNGWIQWSWCNWLWHMRRSEKTKLF